MRDFRSLRVWQHAHRFALDVYRVTGGFPVDERIGLTSQLRRAASSIADNIAEGCGAATDAEQRRFYRIAFRSNCEVLSQLIRARDLGYLSSDDAARLERDLNSIRMMLWRLIERSQG
ncbi:MAG TPA: four helix bundle protein [Gemmatimonadaceae bacterium]|nr:four helix bundle protein [Gemmatimonadaceae bacterium]